jgi:hypothetical protein
MFKDKKYPAFFEMLESSKVKDIALVHESL